MRLLVITILLSFSISCNTQLDKTESNNNKQKIRIVESPIVGTWRLKEFDGSKFEDSLKVVYSFEKFGLVEIEASENGNIDNQEILEFEIKDSILFIGTSEYLVTKLTDSELEFIEKKHSYIYQFIK